MSVNCADGVDGVDVAVLGAVKREVQPILEILSNPRVFDFRGEVLHLGTCGSRSMLIGTTGLGKVNAAITTAAILETFGAAQVWNIGCAGAYEEGPLRVGDVLISQIIWCGDEGVLTRKGIESLRTVGIPLVTRGSELFFDALPAAEDSWAHDHVRRLTPPGFYRTGDGGLELVGSAGEVEDAQRAESSGIFRTLYGPSLTVSLASGDRKTARKRYERFGAMAENMEGSAVAQTCFRYEVPFVECRGMSNMAGDRDKRHWKLDLAVARCSSVVRCWLENDA
jgi:futalosine hydrolase